MVDGARRVAWEVRAMTRKEVIVRAIAGRLTWLQAASCNEHPQEGVSGLTATRSPDHARSPPPFPASILTVANSLPTTLAMTGFQRGSAGPSGGPNRPTFLDS